MLQALIESLLQPSYIYLGTLIRGNIISNWISMNITWPHDTMTFTKAHIWSTESSRPFSGCWCCSNMQIVSEGWTCLDYSTCCHTEIDVADQTRNHIQSQYSDTSLSFGCLMSQQYVSVSQGQICSDNVMCYHTEIEVADHTFHLTQSQYTVTAPTSPSTDPTTPGTWQDCQWSANF